MKDTPRNGSADRLSLILGILFFPITLLASWVVVHPQEEKVILFWGKLQRLLTQPGLYWVNIWGRKVLPVSTKHQTLDLPRTVVADGNGNPIMIAAVVTYEYVDSVKVALEVEDAHDFVKTQAMAVLKQSASKYPYESQDGHSLKAEAQAIGKEMVKALQAKVDAAGTSVEAFELSDLSYAPEIAQSMLVRQQAQALVDARKIVVEGATEIVNDAIGQLSERGLELPPGDRSRLVSNLLTVICGDANVQPTFPIHSASEVDGDQFEKMLQVLENIQANTKKPS
ncbi:MAG: SPFH domain-containing protein [Phycisphaerae bacterium]|nr:SPFH domain-containing protein [Phycisphaerae bacterium]